MSDSDKKSQTGHHFLASLGKTRLRPGGRRATDWLIEQAQFTPQTQVLEVACNMATTAIGLAQRFGCHINGVDLDHHALEKAERNIAAAGLSSLIQVQHANATALPFPDNSFDALTVAYGVRNFEDLDRGLREMHRVLRPGGRLVIIELTSPVHFPMKQLFWLYAHAWMPLVGRFISRDAQAYRYLPASMEAFPQGEVMQSVLQKAGFHDVKFRRFTFGLSTLYTAEK